MPAGKGVVAFVVVALATIGRAQIEAGAAKSSSFERGRIGVAWGPEAPVPPPFDLDWTIQERMAAASPGARAWTEAHPGWRVVFDERTGRPWRSYGPGIKIVAENAGEEELREAAARFAERAARIFDLPGDAPKIRFVGASPRLRYVSFDQTFDGVRANDAGMTLRVDPRGRVVMWGGRFVEAPERAESPKIEEADARLAAVARLRGESLIDAASALSVRTAERVVHASITEARPRSAHAWRLRISADAPRAEWEVFVDAGTGVVREYWNDVRHSGPSRSNPRAPSGDPRRRPRGPSDESGPTSRAAATTTAVVSVAALVHENIPPDQPPVAVPLPDCGFLFDGVPYVTDLSGNFVGSTPNASASVMSGLDGPWITTVRATPPDASYLAATSGPAVSVLFDDTNSSQGERNAFYFASRARNTVLLRNPLESLFNAPLVANVDMTGPCNAFYDGVSINFFLASAGCVNSAYSDTVIEHEYGHHVTTTIYAAHGKSVPGHLGEGFSDAQAGACEDGSVIGLGFYGPGTFVRDMNNTCQWPASCGSGIHARGKVISASYWHTRQSFAAAYGAVGKATMDEYLYAHFHGAPMNETESCLDMLLLDDDDADLSNGTPNLPRFLSGFTTQHGVPFPIPLIAIDHAPLGDTADPSRPYEIRATAASVQGAALTSATLYYSIDGGGFVAAAMALVAGTYVAFIPPQVAAARVSYYLSMADASGATSRSPRGAPLQTHVFRTYRPTTFYFEDFEGGAGGWTSAAAAGVDDWQLQAPNDLSHAYDPPSAYSGVQLYGTDLSAFGGDGNYANNCDVFLTSPSIDCTGRVGVTLRYRRWLTIEDGLYDSAKILVSVNGGPYAAAWSNQSTPGGLGHHIDRAWAVHDLRLVAADGQSSVRLRFQLTSDAGVNFGGWNVDDVALDAIDPVPPLAISGSMASGTFGYVVVHGAAGEFFVLCADVATNGSFVPFVGTISLDPTSPSFILATPFGATVGPTHVTTFPFGVPPGLSGFSIALQSAYLPLGGAPPAISNVATIAFP